MGYFLEVERTAIGVIDEPPEEYRGVWGAFRGSQKTFPGSLGEAVLWELPGKIEERGPFRAVALFRFAAFVNGRGAGVEIPREAVRLLVLHTDIELPFVMAGFGREARDTINIERLWNVLAVAAYSEGEEGVVLELLGFAEQAEEWLADSSGPRSRFSYYGFVPPSWQRLVREDQKEGRKALRRPVAKEAVESYNVLVQLPQARKPRILARAR